MKCVSAVADAGKYGVPVVDLLRHMSHVKYVDEYLMGPGRGSGNSPRKQRQEQWAEQCRNNGKGA
jgi:hypothetical protein